VWTGWGGTTARELESVQLTGWDSLAVCGNNITTEKRMAVSVSSLKRGE
jgi:hypothetical protein